MRKLIGKMWRRGLQKDVGEGKGRWEGIVLKREIYAEAMQRQAR